MIETLKLQNFKILRDVDVKLRPLTVIVGPNSSGKSSILQAILCMMDFFANPSPFTVDIFETVFSRERSPAALSSREIEGLTELACSGWFGGKALRLAFSFSKNDHRFSSFSGNWGEDPLISHSQLSQEVRRAVGRAVSLELDMRKLAAPSYPTDTGLSLPHDGEGLSALLSSLALEEPMLFKQLVQQLKEVVPGVEGIRSQRAQIAERVGFQLLFDMKGAHGIPANAVSEGTLLTLGLLAVLAVPDPPNLLLLDDFERGLHPVAQADLVKQLRRIQEARPDLQIIATSHSPYLLDSLAAEEVLLTALGEDGYAMVKPLTDHPEYERWKDFMDTGEFWSTVGEGWVTKKQPRSAA